MEKRMTARRGFTLIELLIVLLIMSLLAISFLVNQTKYDSATVMRALSYSVALSFRQAQVYGTSVVKTQANSTNNFTSYGLYFSTATNQYVLFADTGPGSPALYGNDDTIVKVFKINSPFSLYEVCGVNGATRHCTGSDDSAGSAEIGGLSVFFARPNPDASISTYTVDSNSVPGVFGAPGGYSYAYVILKALSGDTRIVQAGVTGQVNVCPAKTTISSALTSGC